MGGSVRGMVEGARNALPVGVACALVGIIIGTMTLTELAGAFTQGIVVLGHDSLLLSLSLTMLVCLVLGLLTDDPLAVAYIVSRAVLSLVLWGAAAIGHLLSPLSSWERLLSAAAAFFLVAAVPLTDEIGFALAALTFGIHWWRHRNGAVTQASR